jgi:putative tricarboxylic transport membrane protein
MTSQAPETRARGLIRSPLDLGAGLFLLALGAIGVAVAYRLAAGRLLLWRFGPEVVLWSVALLTGACGLILAVQSLISDRGPVASVVKSPFDLGGGLFLIALAVFGLAGGISLPTGTLSAIGSGFMPRVVSILVAAFGVLLLVHALLYEGSTLERWHLRGPVFVLGGVVMFALLVRGSTLSFGPFAEVPVAASLKIPGELFQPPDKLGEILILERWPYLVVKISQLGLIVAGPVAILVSSIAEKSTKLKEVAVFAVVMTLLAGLLFKEALNLPIPYDPAGLVPDPIYKAYVSVKSAIVQAFNSVVWALAQAFNFVRRLFGG